MLTQCLNLSLGSMETVAMLRAASILHLAVVVPVCWIAGNTHKLAHLEWGERSMGRAVDLLYKACHVVQADGSKLLDETLL